MEQWSTAWLENLQKWFACPFIPLELRENRALCGDEAGDIDLVTLNNPDTLPKELRETLEEAFSGPLAFGTAGLRGKMGVGLNRMNVYTVATATQGVASWLRDTYSTAQCAERGIVIGYDTRHNSKLFAEVAACVFAANGITVHLFSEYCQTPMLAYSIRPNQALAGIMVTASHNPKEYNGYKLYGEDGIQIGSTEASRIAEAIGMEFSAKELEEALQDHSVQYLPRSTQTDYIEKTVHLLKPADHPENIKIAYTAMHGTGAKLVLPLLRVAGFENVVVVKEQIEPDPDFPTAPAPNPEFPKVTQMLRDLAKQENADLALATDPDADRLALQLPDEKGEWHALTGNQTGALLAHYWLSYLKEMGELPANPALVKSIVTDDLGKCVAADLGVHTEESLTGFKDICGKIREFETEGSYTYVMGYEESIGYAIGQNVLDKDGCSASFVFAHAAAAYKARGTTLWQVLQELQQKHGFFASRSLNRVREGTTGLALMKYVMNLYRLNCPLKLGSAKLVRYEDFRSRAAGRIVCNGSTRIQTREEKLNLRSSDVLRYHFSDGSWYALRPSGTEPKLKVYIYAANPDQAAAEAQVAEMERVVVETLDRLEEQFYEAEQHSL